MSKSDGPLIQISGAGNISVLGILIGSTMSDPTLQRSGVFISPNERVVYRYVINGTLPPVKITIKGESAIVKSFDITAGNLSKYEARSLYLYFREVIRTLKVEKEDIYVSCQATNNSHLVQMRATADSFYMRITRTQVYDGFDDRIITPYDDSHFNFIDLFRVVVICVIIFGVVVSEYWIVLLVAILVCYSCVKEGLINAKKNKNISLQLINTRKNSIRLCREVERECAKKCATTEQEYAKKYVVLQNECNKKVWEAEHKSLQINSKNQILQDLLKSTTPFSDVSKMVVDVNEALYSSAERHLREKRWASPIAADTVKEIKESYKQTESRYLQMQYKYDFLLSVFPELQDYIDDEESLLDINRFLNIDNLKNEHDHAKDYLTKEEYLALDECARNQLALDRYKINRRSSSWIAGVEYEMYCCHILRQQGFVVVDFGVQRGLEDLGRDIIAERSGVTYIIQCKRYGQNKQVHENVICQLYGTTQHYKYTENKWNNEVKPVLITTCSLSDKAKEFAEVLNVQALKWEMGEYPMIKCNINEGVKIYHLPFDQQYWTTKIDKEGEFYAHTVKEAMDNGFRRAYKWRG